MNKGYICPQCKTSYSPLEVDKLMDFSRNALICEICHAEVIDNENAETVQGSQDRMQRFNHQMRFIREGLQKSEAMILPAYVLPNSYLLELPPDSHFDSRFDVAAWVKNNPSESDKQKAAQSGSGLKIAGSDPNKKEDEGVGIMLVMDKDESTRRQERDAEADLKRQQNLLPAWHLKSTITGELTALGVKESARTESLMNGSSVQVSNDDILKGLGVIGGGPSKQQQQQQQPVINLVEDVKPTINRESDRTCFPFLSFDLVFHFSNFYQSMINTMQVWQLPLPQCLLYPRQQHKVHWGVLILVISGMTRKKIGSLLCNTLIL